MEFNGLNVTKLNRNIFSLLLNFTHQFCFYYYYLQILAWKGWVGATGEWASAELHVEGTRFLWGWGGVVIRQCLITINKNTIILNQFQRSLQLGWKSWINTKEIRAHNSIYLQHYRMSITLYGNKFYKVQRINAYAYIG